MAEQLYLFSLPRSKCCRKCGDELNETNLSKRGKDKSTGKQLFRTECKSCYCNQMKAYLEANPEMRAKDREWSKRWMRNNPKKRQDYMLRMRFGITVDEYESFLEAQNHKCAICGQGDRDIDRRSGKKRRLAVDHCHQTNTVRGLLCGYCNRVLGMMNDDPKRLEAAANYLRKHA